jgi:membrane-associated phospholipid phosphatase
LRLVDWLPIGFWNFVVNCGDLAVLGPAALAVFIVLLAQRRRAEAVAWAAGMGLCFLLTLTLKSLFGSFQLAVLGHVFNAKSFPSGHVSHSTAFYGGLAAMVWATWRGSAGRLVAAALALVAALVAAAVFALRWHHSLDVIVGFVIGALAVFLMRRFGAARPHGSVQLGLVLATAAAVVVVLHGVRLDDHLTLTRFAAFLSRAT